MPAMTNVEMYLEDSLLPGSAGYKAPLAISVANGYVPQNFNPGYPEVREVVSKRPSANGTFDYTSLFGAKAVSLSVGIARELYTGLGSVDDQILEDRLKAWVLPSTRAFLYFRYSSTALWRRIPIRGANAALGMSFLKNNFGIITLQWKAPDGLNESASESFLSLSATSSTEAGRAYDLTFDRTYPASTVIGTATAVNAGNAPVFPALRIHGPCTQPRVENVTTGKKLEFLSSYSLLTGEFLDISMKDGTVYLNGSLANSRYQYVDFSVSDWWELIPGDNLVRYYPLSFAAPSVADLRWRSQFL